MTTSDDLYKLQPPRWREQPVLAGARESAAIALRASYQVEDQLPEAMQTLLAQLSTVPAR